MQGILVVEKGPGEGRKWSLSANRSTTIGRSSENEIQIYGEEISRTHCEITSQNGQFEVVDRSSNGTFLNGQRIQKNSLGDGDLLRIGENEFRFSVKSMNWDNKTEQPDSEVMFVPHLTKGQGTKVFERSELDQTILMDTSAASAEDLDNYKEIHQNLITIYKVGNLINSIEEPEELFNTLMDTITEVVTPQRAFLLLTHPDTDEIRTAVVRTDTNNPNEKVTLSQTIVQDCVKKGHHILCPDAMMDERFKEGQSIFINKIHSVMCVPLESQKQILGAIYVDSSQEAGAFSERDLELLAAIGRQAGISIERANLFKELEDLAMWSILTLVAAIEAKDEYTSGHSERVSAFSVQIAEKLGLGDKMIEAIRLGALLHDVGKIGVPEAVLSKPGQLTDEEFDLIKEHPGRGAHIISQIHNPRMKHAIDIARHHHERWDGRGYPDKLSGENIPYTARIVGVADAYDAMSTTRLYRKPYEKEFIAQQFVAGLGVQFDSDVAKAFLEVWQEGRLRRPQTLQLELQQARTAKANSF